MILNPDFKQVPEQLELTETDNHSIWTEPDFINLKEQRHINDEDSTLVESLALLPKEIALNHHNFFSLNGDQCLTAIDKDIAKVSEELEKSTQVNYREKLQSQKTYLEIQKQIIVKYGWQTAWNINVVLERRKKNPKYPSK